MQAEIENIFSLLKAHGLFNEDLLAILTPQPVRVVYKLKRALDILKSNSLLTSDYIDGIFSRPVFAEDIAYALSELKKVDLLTDDNYQALLKYVEYSLSIANAWVTLKKLDLMTLGNRDKILIYHQFSSEINSALITLNEAQFLNKENLQIVFEHYANANVLACGLVELKKNDLLASKYVNLLLANPQLALNTAKILTYLKKVNFLTDVYLDLISKETRFLTNIEYALDKLEKIGLLYAENVESFFANSPQYVAGMIDVLELLKKIEKLTPENYQIIFRYPEIAYPISKALNFLIEKTLVSDENIKLLLHSDQQIGFSFARAIDTLESTDLLNNDTLAIVSKKPEFAEILAYSITILEKNNLPKSEIMEVILAYPETAFSIVNALDKLKEIEATTEDYKTFLCFPKLANDIDNAFFKLKSNGLLNIHYYRVILQHAEAAIATADIIFMLNNTGFKETHYYQSLEGDAETLVELAKLMNEALSESKIQLEQNMIIEIFSNPKEAKQLFKAEQCRPKRR